MASQKELERLLMLLVLGLAGSAAIFGCGTSAPQKQTYTITVTGTSSYGGATQSSNPVTLTVSM
ncbi:MAG: hypothetical protein FWD64_11195 [Acidobacteriaceae bacterium]|nr:hypothetical protein [Acidobacteriaceae bacterium]